MQNPTLSAGARVVLEGVHGYVRETSAPTVNAVLVEFDRPILGQFTRHAFVRADDLVMVDDDPLEAHDAANGALWPRTIEEVCTFAEALNIQPSTVMFALEHMRSKRPDWVPFRDRVNRDDSPAGGDLA